MRLNHLFEVRLQTPKTAKYGFSLLEILTVLAVFSLLIAFTMPLGLSFYRSALVDDTKELALTLLRRAQKQAMSQKNSSGFGVKFLPAQMTLFQGSSYGARAAAFDEAFVFPGTVVRGGLDEVVFPGLGGQAANQGTITFSYGSYSQDLTIERYATY